MLFFAPFLPPAELGRRVTLDWSLAVLLEPWPLRTSFCFRLAPLAIRLVSLIFEVLKFLPSDVGKLRDPSK
jgi:hypothetical protein